MENKQKKAIIFARVSSVEQKESGFSLPAQIKLLTEYAHNKNLKIDKTYSISESASKREQRKTFDQMLDYVTKNDVKILIFEKVDRVTRNLKDSVKIQDWLEGDPERQLHCIKDSLVLHRDSRSQEKLNWDLRVAIAKNYADNLSEEVRKGYNEKIAQKIYPGRPKLGYLSVGRGPARQIILDEKKAPLLKKLLEDFSTGNYSALTLMNKANSMGLINNFGRKTSKTAVYRYLTDPFYYGYFEWNGEIYEGKHEPLISKETYDLNQRILKRGNYPKFRIHDYALKGLVKCGECKKMITWYEKKGKVYGECNTKDRPDGKCNQKICGREDKYVKEIVDLLKTFQIYDKRLIGAIRKELQKDNEDQHHREELILENAESRIRQIRSAVSTAYDDRINNIISVEKYQEIKDKYDSEEKSLEEEIRRIKKYSDKQREIGLAIFDLSQNGEKIFKKASNEEKRTLLNVMFSNLYLLDGKMQYEVNPAFEIVRKKVLETNDVLLESSGVVEIRDLDPGKPELGKEAVVIDEMEYSVMTSTVWRNGRDSNPQPSA